MTTRRAVWYRQHRIMDSGPSASGASVLLVEDDLELQHALQQHFAMHGYEVHPARDGADALRQVLARDFDVILCDMVMPHMPGDMFYRAVGRVKPHLCSHFLFVTGHGGSPGVREFLTSVSDQVISKPFNLEDLTEAVRAVAEGRAGQRLDLS